MTDFTIRDAVESDVPALVALINCAYRVKNFSSQPIAPTPPMSAR